MNRTRIYTWSAISLFVIAGFVWAFWPRAIPADAIVVSEGPMTVSLTEEGKVRIHDVYVVSAPTSGHLERIEIEPGDCAIASETVLATLRSAASPTLDARTMSQLAAAASVARSAVAVTDADIVARQADLSRAERDLQRTQTLARTGTASRQAVETQTTEVAALRAALNAAIAGRNAARSELRRANAAMQPSLSNANGDQVTLTAPVSGVVLQVLRDSEGPIAAGAPLLEIGDPNAIEVVADFLSEEAVTIKVGDTARVRDWGGPPLRGTVERIEPFAFTKVSALGIEEQRTNVVIGLSQRPSVLGHGYRVRIDIDIWSSPKTLQAPMTTLFRTGSSWTSYRVKNGRAKLTPVTPGRMNGQVAEILEGAAAGDPLIAHASPRVQDGVRVKLREPAQGLRDYGTPPQNEWSEDITLEREGGCELQSGSAVSIHLAGPEE